MGTNQSLVCRGACLVPVCPEASAPGPGPSPPRLLSNWNPDLEISRQRREGRNQSTTTTGKLLRKGRDWGHTSAKIESVRKNKTQIQFWFLKIRNESQWFIFAARCSFNIQNFWLVENVWKVYFRV